MRRKNVPPEISRSSLSCREQSGDDTKFHCHPPDAQRAILQWCLAPPPRSTPGSAFAPKTVTEHWSVACSLKPAFSPSPPRPIAPTLVGHQFRRFSLQSAAAAPVHDPDRMGLLRETQRSIDLTSGLGDGVGAHGACWSHLESQRSGPKVCVLSSLLIMHRNSAAMSLPSSKWSMALSPRRPRRRSC